jgi:7,8-dihydropterin-6-yl-methyl-4-(beta-D-ribofuranosyl)aminobenzene 5'-phosphate synthase
MKKVYQKGNLTAGSAEFFQADGTETIKEERDVDAITLSVVYNNVPGDPGMKASWGFSAWIEDSDGAVLFDTGSDGDTLLSNMTAAGLDLTRLHTIVISHEHGDHINGLPELTSKLKRQISLLVPADIESTVRKLVPHADIVPVTGPQCITGEIWTTGPLPGIHKGSALSEQSLVITRDEKLWVITGCSHHGIDKIADFVKSHFPGNEIELMTGGFHMSQFDENEIQATISHLRAARVKLIGPSHCTGDSAINAFRETWKENFLDLGLGASLSTS